MRISTAQIYAQGVRSFGVQQTKLATLQEQISTGVRINKPSDDPVASARILELEQTVELNEQFQRNINMVEDRLYLEETTLNSLEGVIQRVRELTLQANNATQDLVSRQAIAFELDELQNQLISLSNTIDANGDYLFAGHQSKVQPFSQNITGSVSHVDFNGDQGQRMINISQSRQINTDTSGSDLFMKLPTAFALNETANTANVGTAQLAPAHVFDTDNYVAGTYQISFDTVSSVPDTQYSVVDASGVTVASGTYVDSTDIVFMGISTSVTGIPANGDSFTVSQGQYLDIFSIVSNLSQSLRNPASGTVSAGSYTFGSAITAFDYTLDSASFDVDGNSVLLNADYTDLQGITSDIQNQLDIAVGAGVYAVTHNGATVSIAQVTPGVASIAPVVNNFNGNVDGNGGVATAGSSVTPGGISVTDYSAGADISFDVDGFNVVLDADYSNLAGVTAEIQADLNGTAGAGVYSVTDDGINITISKVVTGAVSTAPVINNPGGAGGNQAEFTAAIPTNGIDAINTFADFTVGGISVNGTDDSSIHSYMAQAILDIDTGFNKLLEARTSIGGRLNSLQNQSEDNEAIIIATQKTLGVIRDTDLAEAISQLTLEQTTLEAAQAVFAKITSSSLFNFLR